MKTNGKDPSGSCRFQRCAFALLEVSTLPSQTAQGRGGCLQVPSHGHAERKGGGLVVKGRFLLMVDDHVPFNYCYYCQLLSIIVIIITIIVIIITSINYKIRRRRQRLLLLLLLLLFDVIIIILILLFDGHVAVYRIVPVSVGLTSGMRISKVNALEERAQKVIMKSKRRAPCSSIQLHHGYHIQLERPQFGDTRTGELDSNWTSLRSLSVLQTVVFASALPQSREGAFDASGCSPLKMRSRLAFRTCI